MLYVVLSSTASIILSKCEGKRTDLSFVIPSLFPRFIRLWFAVRAHTRPNFARYVKPTLAAITLSCKNKRITLIDSSLLAVMCVCVVGPAKHCLLHTIQFYAVVLCSFRMKRIASHYPCRRMFRKCIIRNISVEIGFLPRAALPKSDTTTKITRMSKTFPHWREREKKSSR